MSEKDEHIEAYRQIAREQLRFIKYLVKLLEDATPEGEESK